MMKRRDILALMGGMAALTATSGLTMPAARPARGPSLAELAGGRGIGFGTALSRRNVRNRKLAELVTQQCSLMTAENALKWKYLEPREGETRIDNATELISFADRFGLKKRGHCFVWNHHGRMPYWLTDLAVALSTRETSELTRRMWRQGALLAREFPNIQSWDALNEAIDPQTGSLRETEFTRLLGSRLVDLSFRILAQKLPGTQLVYNDSMNWEASPTHRDGVLRLLERAVSRGVPIDALGIQSHLGKTLGRSRDEMAWRQFLEEVQGLGLDVVITELDCSDRHVISADIPRRDAETAAFTKGYLDLTLSFTNVRDVVVWSVADQGSYMRRNSYPAIRLRDDQQLLRGHPYDGKLQAKPMRTAMAEAFMNAPKRSS